MEFLTQKGIRIKNVENSNAPRTGGLQEAEIQTDEDDDDYGGEEESDTGGNVFSSPIKQGTQR